MLSKFALPLHVPLARLWGAVIIAETRAASTASTAHASGSALSRRDAASFIVGVLSDSFPSFCPVIRSGAFVTRRVVVVVVVVVLAAARKVCCSASTYAGLWAGFALSATLGLRLLRRKTVPLLHASCFIASASAGDGVLVVVGIRRRRVQGLRRAPATTTARAETTSVIRGVVMMVDMMRHHSWWCGGVRTTGGHRVVLVTAHRHSISTTGLRRGGRGDILGRLLLLDTRVLFHKQGQVLTTISTG